MQEHVARLATAAAALSVSGTSNQVLSELQAYVESLKAQAETTLLLEIFYEIVGKGQRTDAERVLAFHIFEDAILRQRWHGMDQALRSNVREVTFSWLLRDDWTPVISRKIAMSVGGIAEREWPENWPSFIEDTIGLAARGGRVAEMALMVLEFFNEDITMFNDSITPKRRQVLSSALSVSLKAILPFLCQLLASEYDKRRAGGANAELLLGALQTMSSILTWAPLFETFQFVVLDALLQLLRDEELRDISLDCLSKIVNTRGTRARGADEAVRSKLFPGIVQAARDLGVSDPTYRPDTYELQKRLCGTVADAGVSFLEDVLVPVESPTFGGESSAVTNSYLQLMLDITMHPGLPISHACMPFWSAFFRSKAGALPVFGGLQLAFLKVAAMKECVSVDETEYSGRNEEMHQADFDTLAEFGASLVKLKGVVAEAARAAAKLHPTQSLGVLDALCARVSGAVRATGGRDVEVPLTFGDEMEGMTANLPPSRIFRGLCAIAEGILSSLGTDLTDERRQLHGILEQVLFTAASSTCAPEIVAAALPILRHFALLDESAQLPWRRIIEVLLQLCLYRPAAAVEHAGAGDMAAGAARVRFQASSTLLRICKKLSNRELYPLLPLLASDVTALLSSPGISHEEALHLLDALSSASNAASSVEEQATFLENMLSRAEADVASPHIIEIISSAESLWKFVTNRADERERLAEVVHVFEVISHGVTTAALQRRVNKYLLEPMVKLLHSILQLNPPATARELLLLLNVDTAAKLVGRNGAEDQLQAMGIPLGDSEAVAASTFVAKLRDSVDEVLACVVRTASTEDVQTCLRAIRPTVAEMEPASLYSVTKSILRSIFQSSPWPEIPELLQLLQEITDRIGVGVSAAAGRRDDAVSVATDQVWRLVLRACVDAVQVGIARQQRGELMTTALPPVVVHFLKSSITGFDSVAAENASLCVQRAVALFPAQEMLVTCVQALQLAELHAAHEVFVSLLFAIIQHDPNTSLSWLVSVPSLDGDAARQTVEKVVSNSRKSGRAALKKFLREQGGLAIGAPPGGERSKSIFDLGVDLVIPGKLTGRFKDPAAVAAKRAQIDANIDIQNVFPDDETL